MCYSCDFVTLFISMATGSMTFPSWPQSPISTVLGMTISWITCSARRQLPGPPSLTASRSLRGHLSLPRFLHITSSSHSLARSQLFWTSRRTPACGTVRAFSLPLRFNVSWDGEDGEAATERRKVRCRGWIGDQFSQSVHESESNFTLALKGRVSILLLPWGILVHKSWISPTARGTFGTLYEVKLTTGSN